MQTKPTLELTEILLLLPQVMRLKLSTTTPSRITLKKKKNWAQKYTGDITLEDGSREPPKKEQEKLHLWSKLEAFLG